MVKDPISDLQDLVINQTSFSPPEHSLHKATE